MTDRTGQQLGNYRLLRLLGKGGFAEVYLGEHIYLKTPAAIKLLQTKVANQEDLDSFLKEAQTIARLVHPQIVRVLDFGIDSETPFLVMDYAPNGTLRQRHPRGTQLPLTTIVPYVKQVADALQHAHDEKLIHRDIKPENMLLGRRNEVLLSDFGIALIAQSSRYQSTQDVIGTVAYMSPEQIQGKPRPASDQYSLAIVVYEWLSGDRPFHGSFTELCTQHMFASPPPLREKMPTVLPDVEQVVTMALAKDPKQRFGSVQAFANALEQASRPQQPTFMSPQPAQQHVSPPRPATPLPPTTYAPPPPPGQYIPQSTPSMPQVPPVQRTLPSSASYSPGDAGGYPSSPIGNYSAGSKLKVKTPAVPHPKPWSFGQRQAVAALIGNAICVGLVLLILLLTSGSYPPAAIIVLAYVLAALTAVVPQFFAFTFGPWVGLFTGGVGPLLGITLAISIYALLRGYPVSPAQYFSAYASLWPFHLGLALVGFISGFAMFKTKGHYNIGRTLGFSSLGVVAGVAFTILGGIIVYSSRSSGSYYSSSYIANSIVKPLLIIGLIYLVADLIFLPLSRLVYYALFVREKRV
jgi:serine/threonine protein kinase